MELYTLMDDYNDFGGADFAAGLGAFFLFFIVFIGFMLLLMVGVYVFTSLAYSKMYTKSGHPNPWGAWIPFYRDYLVFEHGGVSGWLYIIGYGATYVLSAISAVIMALAPIGIAGAMNEYSGYGDGFGGAAVGVVIFSQIFNVLSYLPLLGLFVLQIFVVINLNRAYSRPGGGMIALGILVPIVWIGILAWSKTSIWRPELAIHGTRGVFFPRQGKTYLERQIALRFGGQMPAHAQKQPKPAPAFAQQPYPGQPGAQPQAPAAHPGQPEAPTYQSQPPVAPTSAPAAPIQPPAVPPVSPQPPTDPSVPPAQNDGTTEQK